MKGPANSQQSVAAVGRLSGTRVEKCQDPAILTADLPRPLHEHLLAYLSGCSFNAVFFDRVYRVAGMSLCDLHRADPRLRLPGAHLGLNVLTDNAMVARDMETMLQSRFPCWNFP